MNETEKVKAALALGGGDKGAEGGKTGQSELEKAQHTADMWAGRAKKNQERIDALEKELAQFKSGKALDAALGALTKEEREDTPENLLQATGKMATKIVGDAQAATNEEIEKLRKELAEKDQKVFLSNISARHKDLLNSVAEGAANHDAWNRYIEENKETFTAIISTNDERRFANFANGFYRELGIPVKSASAALSPTTTGGVSPVGGGQPDTATLTVAEYQAQLEKAEDLRKAGDMKGWREITERLKKALNEGRVK